MASVEARVSAVENGVRGLKLDSSAAKRSVAQLMRRIDNLKRGGAPAPQPAASAPVPSPAEVKAEIPEQLRGRLRRAAVSAEVDSSNEVYTKTVVFKSAAAREQIRAALAHSFLFGPLDSDQLNEVIDSMEEKHVKPGDRVIRQGDPGDYFYIIDHGKFDVLKGIGAEEKKVFFYDGRGSFGELALMYNCPRAATVVATTDGLLWAVNRQTFRHIIIAATREQRNSYETFLQNVKLFANLTHSERTMIADCLEPREYKDGETIIQAGDPGDRFYLVEKGVAAAYQVADGAEIEVGRMERGQFFGERALLTNEPRAATVRAVGSVKVAMMAKDAFERLLGDVKDVLHRHMKSYPSAREILAQLGGGTTGRSIDDLRAKETAIPRQDSSTSYADSTTHTKTESIAEALAEETEADAAAAEADTQQEQHEEQAAEAPADEPRHEEEHHAQPAAEEAHAEAESY